ncbi:MAG: hypothetical protein ACC651_04985 [Candidatus Scalindua sp.]
MPENKSHKKGKGNAAPKESLEKEVLKASFRDTVEKFEQYFNDPEQFNKIFTELGFTYVDDGCCNPQHYYFTIPQE